MKKRLPASFDELIKHHYGRSRHPLLSNAERAEKLFASYYGKPLCKSRKHHRLHGHAAVLSLSYDRGEVLEQRSNAEPFEEYVVSQSVAENGFEEYVLGEIQTPEIVAASSLQIPVTGDIDPAQEYQVDILQPLNRATASAASSIEKCSPCGNGGRVQKEPAAAQSITSPYDVSANRVSEDDFVNDMKAILSGQKVFDPVSKKTVAADEPSRSSSTSSAANDELRPMPDAKNEQAIFDRIAQSMEYANKYDLGTVELQNRFSDFDRISDLQEKETQEAKEKKKQLASAPAPAAPMVDSTDFMRDLESIRQDRYATTAPYGKAAEGSGSVRSAAGAPQLSPASGAQPAAAALSEPIQERCGFFGPNNVEVAEADLRATIQSVTQSEHRGWLDPAGAALDETADSQFGQLVFYTLARQSAIPPSTLISAQAVAVSSGVNYGQLLNAGATADQVTKEVDRVRADLLAGAPGSVSPRTLNPLVHQALRDARASRFDSFAWSAVFVVSCVRRAAIQLGLEGETGGTHIGRDELLLAHEAHRVYVVEAHRRRFGPNPVGGTYHAYAISERAPQVGDIIIQDREAKNIADVVQFNQIPTVLTGNRKLHGDIVVEVAADNVVTIGGNLILGTGLREGVRRRRYPLDASGKLMVAREQLFTQESTTGVLDNVPQVNNAAGLDDHSTSRIFALLSLQQVCAAIPGQPFHGGVLV